MSQEEYTVKPMRNFVEAVSYDSELGAMILTMKGIKYFSWHDTDKFDIYPGHVVEHNPYIDVNFHPKKLMATKVVKVFN